MKKRKMLDSRCKERLQTCLLQPFINAALPLLILMLPLLILPYPLLNVIHPPLQRLYPLRYHEAPVESGSYGGSGGDVGSGRDVGSRGDVGSGGDGGGGGVGSWGDVGSEGDGGRGDISSGGDSNGGDSSGDTADSSGGNSSGGDSGRREGSRRDGGSWENVGSRGSGLGGRRELRGWFGEGGDLDIKVGVGSSGGRGIGGRGGGGGLRSGDGGGRLRSCDRGMRRWAVQEQRHCRGRSSRPRRLWHVHPAPMPKQCLPTLALLHLAHAELDYIRFWQIAPICLAGIPVDGHQAALYLLVAAATAGSRNSGVCITDRARPHTSVTLLSCLVSCKVIRRIATHLKLEPCCI
jgi:hypothetical protein